MHHYTRHCYNYDNYHYTNSNNNTYTIVIKLLITPKCILSTCSNPSNNSTFAVTPLVPDPVSPQPRTDEDFEAECAEVAGAMWCDASL